MRRCFMGTKKTRVDLDRRHSLDVTVNESSCTVVAEMITDGGEPTFIYAEKFDEPCNYLRTAIKKGITYLDGGNGNFYRSDEAIISLNA